MTAGRKPARPKLPRLRWDGHAWAGKIALPSWTGFQVRGGPYGQRRKGRAGARRPIRFAPGGAAERGASLAKPSDEQAAAYAHLLAHEAAVTKAVLGRLLRDYPKHRATYHDEFGIDPESEEDDDDVFDDLKPLPELRRAAELREVMGLVAIHVLGVAKAGVAYVGLELGCDWDEEHGAGLMLHKTRIVKVGGADTSFLEWIAERDGGKRVG